MLILVYDIYMLNILNHLKLLFNITIKEETTYLIDQPPHLLLKEH